MTPADTVRSEGVLRHPSTCIEPVTLAPFRVGLDWLTLNMRGPMALLSYRQPTPWRARNGEQYYWVPTDQRTAVFDKIFYLQREGGEKLLTITGGARSGVTGKPPDWMQVQFANRTLYTGEFQDIYTQLRFMGFSYLGVARMDIAADGIAGRGGDFMEPVQRTWGGGLDYYGKAHWRPRFERKKVTGVELGTRASNKFLRCYDKSRELKQAHALAKAPYINAAWEASLGESPMEMGYTVNRLEVQLKGKEVRRYFPEEKGGDFVDVISNNAALVDMYASMVPKVFDFRTPAKRARHAQDGLIWDFGGVTEGLDVRQRAPKTMSMSPHTIKVMVCKLWQLSYVTGDQSWRVKADELAHGANLHTWYADALGRWIVQAKAMRSGTSKKPKGDEFTQTLFDQLTL